MQGRKDQLSDVLSEFARTLVTDFPIQAILDHLVGRIVDVMPVTAAGATLISADTEPRYIAASNEAALCYERLQTELSEDLVLPPSSPAKRSQSQISEKTRDFRTSPPAHWTRDSRRYSPSRRATATSNSARSISTGTAPAARR